MSNVEEKVDKIEQKIHIPFEKQQQEQKEQQKPDDRTYIITVSDGETAINFGIIAPNLMRAIEKFGQNYRSEFQEWVGLSLTIEEVSFI